MPNPLTLSVLAEALYHEEHKDLDGSEWSNESALTKEYWRSSARALLTTIEKAGYKVVPVEATEEMVAHARGGLAEIWVPVLKTAYAVMLSSSPKIGED